MVLDRALLYDFELATGRVRLWKRVGESYEHVLMKALGYAMYVAEFPNLEIESGVGVRYKPDLVARGGHGDKRRFLFWGECGATTTRKIQWLLKHAGAEQLVLFKIESGVEPLAKELRGAVDERYRLPNRLLIVNFVHDIAERTAERRILHVPPDWYTTTIV